MYYPRQPLAALVGHKTMPGEADKRIFYGQQEGPALPYTIPRLRFGGIIINSLDVNCSPL